MVATRNSGKHAPATDLESMDGREWKRLKIGMVDHPSAGNANGNNNDIGAGAVPLVPIAAQADVDTPDALAGVGSNDIGAGSGPALAPAGVRVPMDMGDTGTVDAASGDGRSIAGAAVEEEVVPVGPIVNGVVVDDDILASRSILRSIKEEPAKEAKREWNRLFWERGVFTRARKKCERAAMKRDAPAKAEAAAAILKMAGGAATAATTTAGAAAEAAGPESAPAPTFTRAQGVAPVESEEGAADMDGDGDDDGCSETTEMPRMSPHFEAFLGRKLVEWAHDREEQRRAVAAFRVDEEALAGTAPHVKDDARYQRWLKKDFVATCGGQGAATFGGGLGGATAGEKGAPSTGCAGTGTAGVGPLDGLSGNVEDGISGGNPCNDNLDTSSTGTTDEEPRDLSPEKKAGHASSPSPSPSPPSPAAPPPSPDVNASNGQGQGQCKGKGKRRRDEDNEDECEDADADGSDDGRGARCDGDAGKRGMVAGEQGGMMYSAGTTAAGGNGGGGGGGPNGVR
eukprot:g15721.t1